MVNVVENLHKPILHVLLKMVGFCHQTVEITPETVMSFWVPKEKLKKNKYEKEKPAVVLIHGFAGYGIYTWQFQMGLLAKKYSVYVPDLLFFGGSTTASKDRSPKFQAYCLITALEKLGVEKCTVVGFSYGGMIAFKMAELRPDLVGSLVVTGCVVEVTDSVADATTRRLGYSSVSEMLLPESAKALRALLNHALYMNIWLPNSFVKDFLQVMFDNRKERAELLEGSVVSNNDAIVPILQQRVLLLWGENDNIFNLEYAKNMLAELGNKATLQVIEKAGHLVHLERPCIYTRHIREFLALVNPCTEQGNNCHK